MVERMVVIRMRRMMMEDDRKRVNFFPHNFVHM